MGQSRSVEGFLKKIHQLETATERERTSSVTAGAATAKKIMLGTAAARGVAPGGKIAGRSWGVNYQVRPGRESTALVRYTGPFHLVNNPTKAHVIRPRVFVGTRGSVAGRRGRGQRAVKGAALLSIFGLDARDGGALRMPGIGFRAEAHHPGTQGKRIFEAAKIAAGASVPQVMARSMTGAWKRALT